MTIGRDWNQRAVPGVTECPWTAPTLRKVLLSARIAGLREHGADPSGKVLGALTPAVWEGAIDRQTWDHVRSVLLNPERLTLREHADQVPAHGPLVFCGVCGGRMLARPRDSHTRRYVCAGRRPRHQLAILAQPTDELVATAYSTCSPRHAFGKPWCADPGGATTGRWPEPSPSWDQPRVGFRP